MNASVAIMIEAPSLINEVAFIETPAMSLTLRWYQERGMSNTQKRVAAGVTDNDQYDCHRQ
jgi:hypothetical protein